MTEKDDLTTLVERAQQLTGHSSHGEAGAIESQSLLLVEIGVAIAVRLDRIADALENPPPQMHM